MQGQLTIANPQVGHLSTASLIAKIGEWMGRVFGCWHLEMSRPFSHQGHAYRMCLNCGAERQFNLGNWEMQGNYYYGKPVAGHFHSFALAAVRKASN